MAAAIKNPAGVDYHARRMHFARHNSLGLDLDSAARENHPIKMPGNDHAVPFNLSFNLRVLPEDHRLLGDDGALHVPINAKGPGQRQRSFERYALINESGPLFVQSVF